MHRTTRWLKGIAGGALSSMLLVLGSPASAQKETPDRPYAPTVAEASDEGQKAIRSMRVAPGLGVELFAAEPMLANPVAFCVDERNRLYVAETFRHQAGVTDTRQHMYWLDDDLASRTVEDRVAMYKKHLGEAFAGYGVEHDRVRLVEDRDVDGKADHATVFADGFKDAAVGIGSGVLARRGDVWYTCIPNLWLLRDTDSDGRADVRRSLHHGYGLHVGFLGHDLHGLRFGPDGKLYFSIGDRGLNVRTVDGRSLFAPDTGSVLRCNPDGSGLEIVATGLRNPQELAFDEHGNLFTCDNNSDSGDKARWVHVVEGGDSGWRIGYQFITSPVSRGPWNAEKLWHPRWDGQAAYLLPPLANISDGPSGLAYDPGTGLPERYRGHFFLCDFRGNATQSGIRTFANTPKGASFELIDSQEFLWSVEATDVDFGTDGALYFTDWVSGWNKTGKGRIYKVAAPGLADDPVARQVKAILAEGMDGRPLDELRELLAHPDMRVRQEAQFALADRGGAAVATLTRVAREGTSRLARLHAIWGLGQVGRGGPTALEALPALLADGDTEVRAQAAKVLGDGRVASAYEPMLALLRDDEPRVRFFAAMGLGKLGRREAVGPILAMLRENADRDAYLRHAGVMALAWIGDVDALLAAAGDDSEAVRTGVLLALRRLGRPEVARFLEDPRPALVLEAARAINDVPIEAAMPALAALAGRSDSSAPLLRRALNANFRLGGSANAEALAAMAGRADLPEAIRVEALEALGDWAEPSGRDRVMGLWRPLPKRPAQSAADALRPALTGLLREGTERVRQATARAAGVLRIREAGPDLLALVEDDQRTSDSRVEALKALEQLQDPRLADAVRRAADDRAASLRTEGLRLLVEVDPSDAVRRLEATLEGGSVAERQGALKILGRMAGSAPDPLLSRWLDRLPGGQVPAEIQLDLLEAAARRSAPEIERKLAHHESARSPDDPLARYRETLAGGNVREGRKIFFQKAEVSCLRCHKVRGQGGEVGPDLSGLGARKDRAYILESIVAPNKQIADGFETRVVATADGQVHTGVFKADDGESLRLMTPEGKPLVVPKADIEEQTRGPSAMPDDVTKFLSRGELRDLVEYLSGLKAASPDGASAAPGEEGDPR